MKEKGGFTVDGGRLGGEQREGRRAELREGFLPFFFFFFGFHVNEEGERE